MPMSTADPLVSITRPNYTLPGLPGTLSADDSIAAKQAALKSHVLGALATIVAAPTGSSVLLDTGQLAAGAYKVRGVIKTQGQFAAGAVDKGVILQHRNAANGADIEQVIRVPARVQNRFGSGTTYFELVVDLAANERLRLVTDSVAFDAGSEVLVVLDVSPAA